MNKSKHYCLDIEGNGPIIGKHSMISIGLSSVENPSNGFYGELCPISDEYDPEALAVSGFTHEQTKKFKSAEEVMNDLSAWFDGLGLSHLIIWSDNPAYDYGWLNWYMHTFLGENRFGHSCRSIGELWCGKNNSIYNRGGWKKFKKTPHTHNAFDDAKGNAEALSHMLDDMR